ncbi:MAG: hypothetical protein WAT19_00665 [Ferruginibacter sp.]
MNLRETILGEHSKAQCKKIVNWVGSSEKRFDELFNLFLHDEYRVVQRAAWPVSYCVQAHPMFIKKHFGSLLNNLQKPGIHNAVKRNTVRLLQTVDIPKKWQGRVMDTCFQYISDPQEKVAVKAFSLTILSRLALQYPEIVPEIALILEDQLPCQTAAFKVRAKQFLKAIKPA